MGVFSAISCDMKAMLLLPSSKSIRRGGKITMTGAIFSKARTVSKPGYSLKKSGHLVTCDGSKETLEPLVFLENNSHFENI